MEKVLLECFIANFYILIHKIMYREIISPIFLSIFPYRHLYFLLTFKKHLWGQILMILNFISAIDFRWLT